MKTRAEVLSDRATYESRAIGAFIGLAVGDAVGDLGRNQEHRNKYGLITKLLDDGKSTDDTEFGVLTARALLDTNGALTPDAAASAWRRYILDRGGAKKRAGRPLYGAIENLSRGMQPPLTGRYNVMNIDDGAAMRASPHGILWAGDPERAAESAAADACVSHDADGIWAAQATAAAVAIAIANGSIDEIVEAARRCLPAGSWIASAMNTAMDICDRHPDIEEAYEELHTKLWTPEHAAAPEAIPQMFAIFRLCAGDPRRGLLWSANFGRDADTISGLVCSLSGAVHGAEAFPAEWAESLRKPSGTCLDFAAEEDIVSLATGLVALSCELGA
ncbi:MAG: ADP-ribosylglycohydrolase family protein [Rectinema subterraneum]|uniref:ADP-ribosylglycohydrolase family protein n=1 Tax=Rectinema subterraneum TaxID=2653714 RepID=UPI003C7DF72D